MVGRPARVRRQRSEVGDWELAEAPPAPALEGLVRGYVGFVETSISPLRRLEPPSASPVLIVNFGAPLEVGAPGRPTTAYVESFVARLSDLPATTAFRGTSAGVQVNFTPLGLHLFCGVATDELPDPAIGLGEVLGAAGGRLGDILGDSPDWESRFDLLDAAIERRFAAAGPPTPSVEWAWRVLERTGGGVEIGRLAERIGCSRRHLITGFRQQVGVPPKTAAQILRFDRAARALRSGRHGSLAAVSVGCGYHDQAHMTREFRAFTGLTPARYRAAALPGFLGVPASGGPEGR